MRTPGTYKIHYDCTDKSGNKASRVTRKVVVKDTTKPVISSVADVTYECSKSGKYTTPSPKCTDGCDGTKQVGVCVGGSSKISRIAGNFAYFNTGTATGCEHRHHYLYDYRGSDCVWTSNAVPFKYPHAYRQAFLRFHMAEYGNLEKDDYLKVELKFCGGKSQDCSAYIPTVKLADDVMGWRWTTVTGSSTYTEMQRHHKTVQIRITLSSNSDYKERHILDNMNVYGVECNHLIAKTFKKTYNLKYTCTDGAGHSDTELQRVTIKDTTPPTIAFKMSYVLQTTSEVAHKGYKGTLDSG